MIIREHPHFGQRLRLIYLIISICFFLLFARLWFLQALRGSHFRHLSENNRTRNIQTLAPRGSVYDREGRVIVGNRPAFQVAIIQEDTPDLEQSLKDISQITGRDIESLRAQLARERDKRHFVPKVVISDATREELARVKVNSYRLPGVIVDVAPTRLYPFKTLGAQALGYAREANEQQLTQLQQQRGQLYRRGDLVGQAGLEKFWEPTLRGKNGFKQVEVDAHGQRKGELGIVDPLPGSDLQLTIDLDMQRAAEAGLAGQRGAVVALDAKTGEVLALASGPSFDANMFATAIAPSDWVDLIQDRDRPLKNRALSDSFPPGSTIKLFLSVAALAEKKISPEKEVFCPGYFEFAGRKYHCHEHNGHGWVNMERAIIGSCNTYFFQLGQQLGVENISKYAKLFGLGEVSGIRLPGEVKGVVPSEEWKMKLHGERWYPGDTLPISVGQGYLTVTPMQMAVAVAALANGGTVFKPLLVKAIRDPNSGSEKTFDPQIVRQLGVDQAILNRVKRAAAGVVSDEKGTGHKAALPGITVGGKTGTAQTSSLARSSGRGRLKDHAWFISFAPVEDPQIAMAVLVENGGFGGVAAAPISKDVMEIYFRKKGMLKEEENKDAAAKN